MEDLLDVLQGILIHVIDERKILDDEEKNGASRGYRSILGSYLNDIFFNFLTTDHLFLNL